jgi:nucleoid DNA-binding protein
MATSEYNVLLTNVQAALRLETKEEAGVVARAVFTCVENLLLDNLANKGFALKLLTFGKFKVHHRRGHKRKIPFTGKTIRVVPKRKVLFVPLGKLRAQERIR